jgi:N-carbamoyl-L-amino-acid hydrolase
LSLDSALDGVKRPGRAHAHEVAVWIGQVVDLGAEAGAHYGAAVDALGLQALELGVEVLRGELEAHGSADLAAAVGIPRQHEERLLLEDEEGADGISALVVGGGRALAEEAGVEIDRPVEIGHVQMDSRDDAHGLLAALRRGLAFLPFLLLALPVGFPTARRARASAHVQGLYNAPAISCAPVPLDPGRTVEELRELQELTGDEDGAQRVAWTDTWVEAKSWLAEKVAAVGAEEETDEAGNQWFTLRGDSDEALLVGGHIDSVPNGGWLDGALNVMAGVEVLRRIAEDGKPPVTVRLVNWADEEGARFGRSLFGSSAAAGSMVDQDELRGRRDADGLALPDVLADHGVELDRALEARRQLDNAAAYLELHIEQGPVLESLELPLGVVLGTFGVERHQITFRGQAAHAGSTPMDQRRDALAGAAKLELEIREIARRVGDGAVCTMGRVVTKPGIVTSVVETAECLLDQRHLDPTRLAEMLSNAEAASRRFAEEERLDVEWERVWAIEPILFDAELVELADEAVREVAGTSHRLPSGPLHDAAEVSRAGIPTVMLFVQSLRGLSHTKLEDTKPEHLELAVRALDRLAAKTIGKLAASA